MADLNEQQASLSVKLTGAGISGAETSYLAVDTNQNIGVVLRSSSGTELSTYSNPELVSDTLNGGGIQAALVVGLTASLACANGLGTNLAARKSLTVSHNGTVTVYWGFTNLVTILTGTPIVPGTTVIYNAGPSTNVYLICGTAAQNMRITECA